MLSFYRTQLQAKPSFKQLVILFLAAFLVRAGSFYFYVQHQERYRQADTMDYHNAALAIGVGQGMTKLNSGQPIFWRTPGYPLYLSYFYQLFGLHSAQFTDNMPAQKAALWVQIFLCSCIPLIIFFLALSLTGLLSIAWITAWLSVIHLGFILSSTFLLTEGLALIFFYLFLIFFYQSFRCYGEPNERTHWVRNIILTALMLGITSWIRPMGHFVGTASMVLLAAFANESWRLKLKKILLFGFVFLATLAPWYVRNYKLTHKVFYWPAAGTYLNAFVAPKVLRSIHETSFETNWKQLQNIAHQRAIQAFYIERAQGNHIVPEHIAGEVAWPIIMAQPWYAFKAWMPEVIKSTFDLYSSQLVSFANNSFMWDPLEEFLGEKLQLALYKQPMPFWMRAIAWIELLFNISIWILLIIGMFQFWITPLLKRFKVSPETKALAALWFKCLFLTGGILFMTGGFGYGRLRLPVEPLLWILALTIVIKRRK